MITIGAVALGGVWLIHDSRQPVSAFASASKKCAVYGSIGTEPTRLEAEDARAACVAAVESNPTEVEALFRLAKAEYALGNAEAARTHIGQAASLGHAPALLSLAFYERSPVRLEAARAAYQRAAEGGAPEAIMAYAEMSLYNANGGLRDASQMQGDGTYHLFQQAAQSGSAEAIANLAYKLAPPRKAADTAENNNAIYVSDQLYEIASQAGSSAATTALAEKSLHWTQRYASAGMTEAAANSLQQAEQLARHAMTQAGGSSMSAGLLLADIEEIKRRNTGAWSALLGALLTNLASSSNRDRSQGSSDIIADQERERAEQRQKDECFALAMGGYEGSYSRAGC